MTFHVPPVIWAPLWVGTVVKVPAIVRASVKDPSKLVVTRHEQFGSMYGSSVPVTLLPSFLMKLMLMTERAMAAAVTTESAFPGSRTTLPTADDSPARSVKAIVPLRPAPGLV